MAPKVTGSSPVGHPRHAWWQTGVIYQVYPRSFQDSDGDGIGDLAGITSRLDYLRWLGVDAIWLSPINPSPMVDFGYDVSYYTDVDPIFGTLTDFDRLVAEAHARSIRVICDFVPNHTSDQHPWFIASRSSRDDPNRDWYLWRDPAPGGGPPNNWLSHFGGSAWTFDERTGQYYYHAFTVEQPDLNWRNPAVRAAMYTALRFWLDRGVDGFRVDVLWHLVKDEHFRDNPPDPEYREGVSLSPYHSLKPIYSADRPEIHQLVAELRSVLEEYEDRLLIGEIYLPVERLVAYYGSDGLGAHLPYNFHLILTEWNARKIGSLIDRYEGVLPPGAWPSWVLGNHDQPRVASRIGPEQARVAAVLLLTLRGTPTIYNGEEIGMHDVPIPPDLVRDPEARAGVPSRPQGRDPYRTPMQWDASVPAGFTTGVPWLPLAADAAEVNVARQREDPSSMLRLYRALLELRRREAALTIGSYESVPASGDLLAYMREHAGRRLLVVLNLGHAQATFPMPEGVGGGRVLLNARRDLEGEAVGAGLTLGPDDALIVELR
ncbi:MAG: alpha-amylase family glycosyl hydrolase [Candidatus Limnocylindria bacterium]